MSREIRHNHTHKLAKVRAKNLRCREYDLTSHFEPIQCDPKIAWTKFDTFPHARLSIDDDGKYTVRIHNNLWYRLEEASE